MMQDHLREVHERGEPIAGLWASESSIYGRFGYGPASERVEMTLDKQWARLRNPVDIRGSIQLVDKSEALENLPGVYQVVHWPGHRGVTHRCYKRQHVGCWPRHESCRFTGPRWSQGRNSVVHARTSRIASTD